jgi:hypothetical protein
VVAVPTKFQAHERRVFERRAQPATPILLRGGDRSRGEDASAAAAVVRVG